MHLAATESVKNIEKYNIEDLTLVFRMMGQN